MHLLISTFVQHLQIYIYAHVIFHIGQTTTLQKPFETTIRTKTHHQGTLDRLMLDQL